MQFPFFRYSLFLLVFFFSACRQMPQRAPEVVLPDVVPVVHEVQIPSAAMNKSYGAFVLLPTAYQKDTARHFPVVYLLHGYSGAYGDWYKKMPSLLEYADQHEIIIVTPDGNYSSWYLDSPLDQDWQFETYVGVEIPKWVDANYRTVAKREGRAITGLSMGGHGGLYLAFNHQDIFGAAGSMSGGVDIRPFSGKWDLAKRIGSQAEYMENWEEYSVVNRLDLLKPETTPALIIDCGVDDFFYQVNLDLHQKLLERKIAHDFISRPGEHTWPYWENAVVYQLLFFDRYFKEGGY